jgi:ATP-dependent DNA helicase RecQ
MTELMTQEASAQLSLQLKDHFGFDAFRPGQEAAIARLMAGRSTLAIFPTGGGKSLCYQLPALLLEGLTVVISPLIALMKDQLDFLISKGAPAARLDSTLSREENRQLFDDLYAGTLKLLYISPERLGNERFLRALGRQRIALLAIDEAHCISEWGHNFRPDYLKIAHLARALKVERVLALTATATPAVANDVRQAFDIADNDEVHTGFYRPNLTLSITTATGADRHQMLLEKIRRLPAGPTIVYVTLQHTAAEVAAHLAAAGLEATAYHAGLKAEERAAIQDAFMASPKAIIVATIAFGMGVDKADIRYVYHYNLPKGLESYSQEIGRAGRDGQPAACEMLVAAEDVVTLENFSYGDTPEATTVDAFTRHILDQGESFDVSEYELSNRFDLRPLVVKTLMTYLELEGCLEATGPFYSEYRFQPQRSSAQILADLDDQEALFLRSVFRHASKGRIWLTLDTAATSQNIGQPRRRIVTALENLEEKGELVLQVSGVRQGYRRVHLPQDMDTFTAGLNTRFQQRETNDIDRVQQVMRLAQHPGCITQQLLEYFGEERPACGHCDRCLATQEKGITSDSPGGDLSDSDLSGSDPSSNDLAAGNFSANDEARIHRLVAAGHQSVQTPRQLARFLCGLTSPATTRARLRQKTDLFGLYNARPFKAVLKFAGQLLGA